jgi:4'-phosphopantetheinyl transferase
MSEPMKPFVANMLEHSTIARAEVDTFEGITLVNQDSISGLAPASVDLWMYSTDQGCAEDHRVLSTDERARAARMVVAGSQCLFIRTRAWMRRTLAGYVGCDPAALVFDYGHHGKPQLRDFGEIEFNLSHSQSYAILAITRSGPLGVDIERCDCTQDFDELAAITLTSAEQEPLRSEDDSKVRCHEFFRLWVRKEAYLKALGTGFATFAVPTISDSWRVVDVPCPHGYRAALCVGTRIRHARFCGQNADLTENGSAYRPGIGLW